MACIEKRGNNSYRLTVSCGYDKQGKKIIKRKTIDLSHISPKKQQAEIEKQLILFQQEVENGMFLDAGKITFEQFVQKWLKDYAEPTLAPKTLFSYKELLNGRIIPALGHIKLNKLQPNHLIDFYSNLRENGIRLDTKYVSKENFSETISKSGLTFHDILINAHVTQRTISHLKNHKNISSAIAFKVSESIGIKHDTLFDSVNKKGSLSGKTILYHHRVISSILTCAVQWQYILSNPASRVKPPKVDKKEARHFNVEQISYIFELINNEPIKYKAMVYLCVFGGMRAGELNGLEWSDLDTTNNTLKIKQTSQYLPGKGTFTKSTKNQSSERIISLPEIVMAVLREYKLWQNSEKATMGNLWNDTCTRIFTTAEGNPIFPQTLGKWFSKFIKRHNDKILNDDTIKKEDKVKYLIDNVNFHGLRHTSATLLINQGVDIATVSKRLGHAEVSTTLNIYTHALQKSDKAASDKLESLFTNNMKDKKQG